MKKIIITILLLVPISVFANHSLGFKWPSAKNIRIYDATVDPVWDELLPIVVADWNKSPYVNLKIIKVNECGNNKGITVCEMYDPNSNYGALSTIQLNGTKISRVRIEINMAVSPTEGSKQRALCHEMGHALGLAHNTIEATDSCLGPFFNIHPGVHDYEQLQMIYGE